MMAQLRSYPVYFWTEKVLKVLFTGIFPLRRKRTFVLYRYDEYHYQRKYTGRVRLRAGGMTTAWLNPHLFGRGYMAYGFRDHRVKDSPNWNILFIRRRNMPMNFLYIR